MDASQPEYLRLLHGLSASGRATRSALETERQLAECRVCPRWLGTCSILSAHEFALMLADANQSCDRLRTTPSALVR